MQYAGNWYTYAWDPFYFFPPERQIEDYVRVVTVYNDTYMVADTYGTLMYVCVRRSFSPHEQAYRNDS